MPSPADAARGLAQGFLYHDSGQREAATDAFAVADAVQFAHLADHNTRTTAVRYTDALWAKDEAEATTMDGAPPVGHHAWDDARAALGERAAIAGMDDGYVDATIRAWSRHKRGGDYWTPLLQAQRREVRAAIQDETYPDKDRAGLAGFGPLPVLYLFGVELHDTLPTHDMTAADSHRLEMAFDVLTAYFDRITAYHGNDDSQ